MWGYFSQSVKHQKAGVKLSLGVYIVDCSNSFLFAISVFCILSTKETLCGQKGKTIYVGLQKSNKVGIWKPYLGINGSISRRSVENNWLLAWTLYYSITLFDQNVSWTILSPEHRKLCVVCKFQVRSYIQWVRKIFRPL